MNARPSFRLSDLPPSPAGRQGWPWTDTTASAVTDRSHTWPRISIVTPSFNQAAFLEETIRSVLLQGYPNLQYIVVDGGSTDGSVEIIQKYAPWLDHWVSEPDRGQSHAINKALRLSDGEWFNWVNSDDFLLPGALFALATPASTPCPAHIIAGATQNLRDGKVFGTYAARVVPRMPEALFQLGVNQPGSLLRRETVAALGGVREDLRLTMDHDLWLRILLRHGPPAYVGISDVVGCYRYHAQSKTCSADDVFALDEFALLHDVAAQCGVDVSVVADLRRRSPIPSQPYPADFAPETAEAEKAWLHRLVVSDTLLFRALRRAFPDTPGLGRRFVNLLTALRPAVARHFGAEKMPALESRALVAAQQALGRYDAVMAARALARSPTPATTMEIVRLLAWKIRRK